MEKHYYSSGQKLYSIPGTYRSPASSQQAAALWLCKRCHSAHNEVGSRVPDLYQRDQDPLLHTISSQLFPSHATKMRSPSSSTAAIAAALIPLANAVLNITLDTSSGVIVGHEYPVILTSDTDYYVNHLHFPVALKISLVDMHN